MTLIGYVTTSYGKRSVQEVKADVDRWISFYPDIQGIFFDEQASGEDRVAYLAELYNYVRRDRKLKLVISNPGTVCSERYFTQPAFDLACVFEGPRTAKSLDLPQWLGRYMADRVVVLPYRVRSAAEMKVTLREALERKIGMIYVTDADGANPWNRLPSYWDDEVAALREMTDRRATGPRSERGFQTQAVRLEAKHRLRLAGDRYPVAEPFDELALKLFPLANLAAEGRLDKRRPVGAQVMREIGGGLEPIELAAVAACVHVERQVLHQ